MPKKKTTRAPASETLLVELLTEELPPKSLNRLSEAFVDGVFDGLKEKSLLDAQSKAERFSTPRRLAVSISAVRTMQPDRVTTRKGPSVQAALDASGQPTQALLGFARSCGVESSKLERRKDEKGEYFVYQTMQKGEPLAKHLSVIVEDTLKNLPVAKVMHWGSGEIEFARPVHGLVMLHGNKVVPGSVLGLTSGKTTLGHRFMSGGPVVINHADHYEKILEKIGGVIPDPKRREQLIANQLDKHAGRLGKDVTWTVGKNIELLGEVASLVEYPVVDKGNFSRLFLLVPEECLIISMQQHQRYFPLKAGPLPADKLLPHFLFVSNIKSGMPRDVIHGNERVLHARLSDAKFFYDQDRKTKLADRVPRLVNVVYHNKLGSQFDRTQRLEKLAGKLAEMLSTDVDSAKRAAHLCKADLLTEMVGEFPELQGIMGRYYALHDGEPKEVADAIEAYYRPRFAGDNLPKDGVAVAVALADKLDGLAGLFGIGQAPTGDKDPFGLRRSALGAIRILVERDLSLDLFQLVNAAFAGYNGRVGAAHTDLEIFIFDRLSGYLRDRGYSTLEVESVVSLRPVKINMVPRQLEAVRAFNKLPEAESLAAANKRVVNILKQAAAKGESFANATSEKLKETAERALFDALRATSQRATKLFNQGDFTGYLKSFAVLKSPVDAFFDSVMVMVEDRELRQNRLALLTDLREEMNRVADISKLAA